MLQVQTPTEIDRRKETACSCVTCKLMCWQSPCFPTPKEVTALVDAGFKEKLSPGAYIDIDRVRRLKDINAGIRHVVSPRFKEGTGCVFQNEDGLCELHDLGLKPLEGRLAHHSLSDDGLRSAVCDTWISREGIDVMKEFNTDSAVALQREFLSL